MFIDFFLNEIHSKTHYGHEFPVDFLPATLLSNVL